MDDQQDRFIIVRPDGTPVADIYGNVAEFTSRAEAERWLMPGERVERRSPRDG